MNNFKERTKRAFIWDYLGNFFNYFLNFLITLFLARLLSPEDYGSFAIVTALGSISSLLMDTGLNSALVQKKKINDEHYGTVFIFNIAVGIILFLFFLLTAPIVSAFYQKPILENLLRVYSVVFVISAFGIVRRTKLRKELDFRTLTKINLTSNIISGIIAIGFAFAKFGIWCLIIQAMLNVIISNIILYYKVDVKHNLKLRFSIGPLKYLWEFGFPMFLTSIINKFSTSFESLLTGKIFSLDVLGNYNRAQSFNNFITVNTTTSITNIFFPALSIIQDDDELLRKVVYKVLHILSFVVFFLLGFIYLVSDDLVLILLTDKWISVSLILKILLISGFTYPISAFLLNILKGKGYSGKFLKLELIKQIFFFSNFITAFIWGFYYYLIGFIIVSVIGLFINIIFVSKVMQLNVIWFLGIILKYFIIASAIAGLFLISPLNSVFTNHYYHLPGAFIFFTVFYYLANFFFKSKGLIFFKKELKSTFTKERNRNNECTLQ